MRAYRVSGPSEFAARAGGWLARDPVRHTIVCSALTLAEHEPELFTDACWLVVQDDDGALAGAASYNPPYGLAVLPMPEPALVALADLLAAEGTELPGVTGPAPYADRFAALWAERTGHRSWVAMALRLFRLDEVTPPVGVAGRLRDSGRPAERRELAAHRELFAGWVRAFLREAAGEPAAEPQGQVDRLLRRGGLCVWYDGDPVSFASRTVPTFGVSRIGLVCPPPRLRGRGYASACVAAVCERALAAGVTPVLFTDLANPVSNRIYQRIGFRAVTDTLDYRFDPPG